MGEVPAKEGGVPGQVTPNGQVHPAKAGTPLAGTPPARYTPLGSYTPTRSSACWEIRATSGWYASYWNPFLFTKLIACDH